MVGLIVLGTQQQSMAHTGAEEAVDDWVGSSGGSNKIPYSGKVWRGESLVNLANRLRFAKLKPSKLVVTIDNPLADVFIRQTFFREMLEKGRFAKHSARQTFLLYGI